MMGTSATARSRYKRLSNPIRELAQNPDINVQSKALSKNVEGLHDTIPNISQSMQTLGSRTLGFLHSQMPMAKNELMGDQEFEPAQAHQRKWLAQHDIVNDPISVLDHVRNGTLTQDHMNALQAVHPELLQEMQQKVMGEMEPNRVKNLPSTTKISLSKFLGAPVTQSILPATIIANQAAIAGPSPTAQPTKAPKTTEGGLAKLNLGQRSATETAQQEEDS